MTTVSTKPYLIRAIHEWCVDQGLTPHIAVAIDSDVVVPPGYDKDGQIILNLSPDATSQLAIGNDAITFQARFGGKAHKLFVPIANVIAVYAAQNGQGMAFEMEAAGEVPTEGSAEEDAVPVDTVPDDKPVPPGRRSHLKVIK